MSNPLRKNISNNPQTITIASIADELGISKSTVSRVLSGKGRISEETRQKVLNYAEEHNYTPNLLAKGLATSKTFNIGVVLPRDASQTDMPFFHTCLAGITEEASKQNYDILVSLTTGNEIDNIEKTVRNNKVDGIILTRLLQNDQRVKYLQTTSVPFLVIGTSDDSGIIQVDSNNEEACIIFTKELIKKGFKSFIFICANSNIVVNSQRCKGFLKAMEDSNVPEKDYKIFSDIDTSIQVSQCLNILSERDYDCVICSDDVLCTYAISCLKDMKKRIPDDIKLASFYNSVLLSQNVPAISAININASDIGSKAASVLCKLLQDETVTDIKNYVNYEFLFRDSTLS
ncbi:MAG: LacI family transcriptional regulator [Spirochaetia bacterium]|nr:LacI family transcriptional regulator [Spirochaetia bacterium]